MPAYDYKCDSCPLVFEVHMKMIEVGEKEVVCPECESTKVNRFFSSCNFKITPSNVLAAKKAGLNMDHYDKAKEQREAKKKEEGHSSEAFNAAVDAKLNYGV